MFLTGKISEIYTAKEIKLERTHFLDLEANQILLLNEIPYRWIL